MRCPFLLRTVGGRKAGREATAQEAKSRYCIFLLGVVTLAEEKGVECHQGGPRDGGVFLVKQPPRVKNLSWNNTWHG